MAWGRSIRFIPASTGLRLSPAAGGARWNASTTWLVLFDEDETGQVGVSGNYRLPA
jgi:hypothetical protein